MITVSCVCDSIRVGNQLTALVIQQLRTAARALNISQAEVTVLLTGSERTQALNREFRGKNKPTDVLSFAMRDTELFPGHRGMKNEYLGHIVINMDDVRVRARRLSTTQARLAAFLALHGFLHLLGYDHLTKKEEAVMRTLERTLSKGHAYYDHV